MGIKKFDNFESINEGSVREILPKMVSLSNNSQITNMTANVIIEKFTTKELNDFKVWLRLVEDNIQMSNKKRYF